MGWGEAGSAGAQVGGQGGVPPVLSKLLPFMSVMFMGWDLPDNQLGSAANSLLTMAGLESCPSETRTEGLPELTQPSPRTCLSGAATGQGCGGSYHRP